ncbi:MAG: DUF58 domain-containing protein [Chloroherpetonaceae bacterium]|nr:DUF58 domain-containing protein [Chloroherpetonaceae bacterium]
MKTQFLDAKTISALGSLKLVAEKILDGFLLGMHSSPMSGIGLEFNQYRSYQPGDDLRRIDWKMLARSDKYFVRECDVETSIGIRLILDASDSMRHEEDGMSKFDYARYLAGAIGLLSYRQGDQLGLQSLGEERIELPFLRSSQHLNRFLLTLEKLQAKGVWPKWEEVSQVFTAKRQRTMAVVFSDLYEIREEEEIKYFLKKISSLGNEVILFHLFGEREATLNYDEKLVEDLETGKRISIGDRKIRAAYRERFNAFMKSVELVCVENGVGYHAVALQTPLEKSLRTFFLERGKKR